MSTAQLEGTEDWTCNHGSGRGGAGAGQVVLLTGLSVRLINLNPSLNPVLRELYNLK